MSSSKALQYQRKRDHSREIAACKESRKSKIEMVKIPPSNSQMGSQSSEEKKTEDSLVKPGIGRQEIGEGDPVDAGPPPMKVEIILFDEKDPLAMINGQSVHQGDKISGATISSILKDRVVIEYNGKTYTKFLE